jgi:hypothetical protein
MFVFLKLLLVLLLIIYLQERGDKLEESSMCLFFYFTSWKVKLLEYCPRSSLDIFLLKPNGMDISQKYENAGLVLSRYINVSNAYRINQDSK